MPKAVPSVRDSDPCGRRTRRTVPASLGALVAWAAAGALLLAGIGVPSGAGAATAAPRLAVSPASNLDRSGPTPVTVTGSGFKAEGNGVYLAWCKVVPELWKSPDNCADQRWVHAGGTGSGGQIRMNPDGSFSTQLQITPSIGDVSCLTPGKCAVATMAAHGSPDRDQDSYASVQFAAEAAAPATPPAGTGAPPPATTAAPPPATTSAPAPDTPAATSTTAEPPAEASAAASDPAPASDSATTERTSAAAGDASRTGTGQADSDEGSSAALWIVLALVAAVAIALAAVLMRIRSARPRTPGAGGPDAGAAP